jgi:2-dehydropantoate 2-reductase
MPAIAIVGGGAVGTVLAAAAEDAGADTVVCTRTPVDRLLLESEGHTRELDVPLTGDPAAVRRADWVLLTTKVQDTRSARPWLERLCGPDTTVVVLQNGVGHTERVQPLAGEAAVVPGLVYIAAERTTPGRVVHRRGRRLVLPRGNAARALASLLAGSGLEVEEEPDFTTALWRKLLGNVAANPVTALTGRRMDVLRDPEVRDLAEQLLSEAAAVGAAEGARLSAADVADTLAFYDRFGADDGTSMLYDRLAGRALEHEHISGAVTRLGRRHGVPTPANQAVYALLGALRA